MKAGMNGVLNLSVLDGWWPECYNGKNGWTITAGEFYRHPELRDTAEANQIYDLLEEQITELFYDRNELGIPQNWVKMMKESISSICRLFNMNRVILCYLNSLYLPSKRYAEKLSENNYSIAKEAVRQMDRILKSWDFIKLKSFTTDIDKKEHLVEQDIISASCTVDLGQADPDLFTVELFYMINTNGDFKIIPMQLQNRQSTLAHYQGSFQIQGYGLQNFNIRIRPANEIVQDLHPELVKWKELS
jgi:starch phosphorylase